jgi:REP element-mobilizing transposase RayT
MPRAARIDIPGLLQHVIIRGIERRSIFTDDHDREDFLARLSCLLRETETDCYAWVLLDNHVHLLLKPRAHTLENLMRRLLSGYAVTFNLRHNRSGHLFQNRYKSIVCDENPYLLELLRYIHLNPIRAGITKNLASLEDFPWSGHHELLGKSTRNVIETTTVLALFAERPGIARSQYEEFLSDGLKIQDGINLSRGGKHISRALNPALSEDAAFDERILGGGCFVEKLTGRDVSPLADTEKAFADLVTQVTDYFGVSPDELTMPGKAPRLVQAKAVICHLAARHLGFKGVDLGKKLGYSSSAVSHALKKGAKLLHENNGLAALLNKPEKL